MSDHRWSMPLTFWPHRPIIQGYTCFTSITSIHWCLHRHTSCHWLEAPAGPSTENLASTGGRRYGSRTHQCLSIHNPGPLVVEIATTLSWSSAAVSEWVSEKQQHQANRHWRLMEIHSMWPSNEYRDAGSISSCHSDSEAGQMPYHIPYTIDITSADD